eukprot:361960-Chlamydomonas_euryale.AAC.1
MVLPKRLELDIPPSVTSVAEVAVGRDTIMRAVASAVLQSGRSSASDCRFVRRGEGSRVQYGWVCVPSTIGWKPHQPTYPPTPAHQRHTAHSRPTCPPTPHSPQPPRPTACASPSPPPRDIPKPQTHSYLPNACPQPLRTPAAHTLATPCRPTP